MDKLVCNICQKLRPIYIICQKCGKNYCSNACCRSSVHLEKCVYKDLSFDEKLFWEEKLLHKIIVGYSRL